MFPIGDDDTSRRTVPLVTYALVILNVIFFIIELSGGESFIGKWAFVPGRFLANPLSNFLTLFTSMFMHAGWVHLGGNMLYLWIFGDNVEDRFGHLRFIIFYLLCGLAATFAQLAFSIGVKCSEFRSIRSNCRSAGRLHFAVPKGKSQSVAGPTSDSSARPDSHWDLDRSAIF